ncbi:unnamed protein product [Colias eurytheme]|nr:unnamed protein product [Colias eurytheme]
MCVANEFACKLAGEALAAGAIVRVRRKPTRSGSCSREGAVACACRLAASPPAARGGEHEPTWPCCFSHYVRIAARAAFAIVNNIYSIPAYVVWMLALRLTRPLYAPLYWKIEGLMYHWLLAMVSLWSWTAGYESEYMHMNN